MDLAIDDHLQEAIKRKRHAITLLKMQRPRYRETATVVCGDEDVDKAEWLFRDALIAREERALRQYLEFAALEG